MTRRSDHPSITIRMRPELIERMNAECDRRLIGRRMFIEAAVEQLCDRLDAPALTEEVPRG